MQRAGWVVMVVLLGQGACTNHSPSSGGAPASTSGAAPQVSGAEAKRLVAAGAVLLDVRTEEEFLDGHIEGARNLPLDQLASGMGGLPRDKPIVVYCAAGRRSARAAGVLQNAGYDVRNLGPMAAWNR